MNRPQIEKEIKLLTSKFLTIKWSRLKKHDAEKSLLPAYAQRIKKLKAKLQAIDAIEYDI